MIPARSDVTILVLSLVGDTSQGISAAGGTIYTQTFQAGFLNSAYQEMYSRLSVLGGDRVQRENYFVLPPNTTALAPVTAGIQNFTWPEEIRERSITATAAVSAVTPNSPAAGRCSVTLATPLPASAVSGVQLDVFGVGGITDDINDSYGVTVTDSTHIILEGCTASGTYTSGGTVVWGGLDWSDPLEEFDTTDNFTTLGAQSALGAYAYQKSVIRFPSVGSSREIKIVFNLSASLPVTSISNADSMLLDDSLNFLAHRTAQIAAASKGNPRAAELKPQADYHRDIMLSGAGRALQAQQPIVPPLFRGKRNTRWAAW